MPITKYSKEHIELYQNLGKLFYAITVSDNKIESQEYYKVIEMVKIMKVKTLHLQIFAQVLRAELIEMRLLQKV